MQRSIAELKGIGPNRAEVLKSNNIQSLADLLYYFPRRYLDRKITEEVRLEAGINATLLVTVLNTYLAHGRKTRLQIRCRTGAGEVLNLVFFRSTGYFRRVFHEGDQFIVSGKIEFYRGFQMMHPDFEQLADEDSQLLHVGRIVPLYPGTEELRKASLDSRAFRRMIHTCFEKGDLEVEELLPASIQKKHKLVSRREALENIHFPADDSALQKARTALKYEEIFLFMQLLQQKQLYRKKQPRELWPLPLKRSPSYDRLQKELPFDLTGEQSQVISTIIKACQANHSQAFLLQGDVGSGKTIVALSVALHYSDNDCQVVMMAPTEVLARQHYQTLLGQIGLRSDLQIELLIGSERAKRRGEILESIQSGTAKIIVGTHSLIEEPVKFQNLGLVIIDEQHRFGVEQRERLRAKGPNPDLIVMTATPIPRSLSLTAFGDLQLVTLKEKPAGRQPIKTMWLREDRRSGVYKSIRKHVKAGRQCYIIYPVITESEKLDLRNATDAYEELKTAIFPEFTVELLHGRLKPPEREKIMAEFRAGRVQILVATTVIEVGVDVPNATVIVIEHAERFGISQLHQMRGRVGRGSEESFCVLLTTDEVTPEAEQRLQAVETSNDGFFLAEEDLKIRGPGEILGLRQHGLPGFLLADPLRDLKLFEAARQDVIRYPEPTPAAVELLRERFSDGFQVYPG